MDKVRIVCVDDEDDVLASLKRALTWNGYDVIICRGSEEALQFLAGNKVDIVIADYRMPYLDGKMLLLEIARLYPGIKRIMLSGCYKEDVARQAQEAGCLLMLKPWQNNELIANIAAVIDGKVG